MLSCDLSGIEPALALSTPQKPPLPLPAAAQIQQPDVGVHVFYWR